MIYLSDNRPTNDRSEDGGGDVVEEGDSCLFVKFSWTVPSNTQDKWCHYQREDQHVESSQEKVSGDPEDISE